MAGNHGKFVWYDLMTSDLAAAETFYRQVIGWDIRDSGMPGQTYHILSTADGMVGGMMTIPEKDKAAGVPPCWTGYINVDDVDTDATRVKAEGGQILKAPEDIPGVGRFAVVADPQGAVFILFRSSTTAPQNKPSMMTPGQIGWHELSTTDSAAAWGFYEKLFGWTKDQALDMGPSGIYQLFRTGTDQAVGGMVAKPPKVPRPFWLYYFAVPSISKTAERVGAAGAKVLFGPQEVPGGMHILQCIDPQGAFFALVGPK